MRLVLTLAVAAAACVDRPVFVCDTAADCVGAGDLAGTCEPSGYCSFADATCPSGSRYGNLAGGGLAGACVVVGGGDPDGAPPATDAMPGAPDALPGTPDAAPPPPLPWWDAAWDKRRRITVRNLAAAPLAAGYPVLLPVDIDALLMFGEETYALRVLAHDGGGWTQLTRVVDYLPSSPYLLWFPLEAAVAPGATAEYWLYYGNPDAVTAPNDESAVFTYFTPFEYGDPSLGALSWTGTAYFPTGDSEIRITAGNQLWTDMDYPPGYALDTGVRIPAWGAPFYVGWHDAVTTDLEVSWRAAASYTLEPHYEETSSATWTGASASTDSQTHVWSVERNAGRVVYRYDGQVIDSHVLSPPDTYGADARLYNGTGGDLFFDFLRIRPVADPAPEVTLGLEELQP